MKNDSLVPRVYYPVWAKIVGIVGIPALVGVGIAVASMPLWDDDVTLAHSYFFTPLGLAVLYQCYIGARCLPHLNTVVSLYEDGIDVERAGGTQRYPWYELQVRHFAFATTTGILTKDGNTVVYFSDGLPNLELLVQRVGVIR